MDRAYRIALAFQDATVPAGRAMMLGVFGFAHSRQDWRIHRGNRTANLTWQQAVAIKPDGILGILNPGEDVKPIEAAGVPVVILNPSVKSHPFASVVSDHAECARRAACHLIEHHLSHFAGVGIGDTHFSTLQRRGFEQTLADAGVPTPIPWFDTPTFDENNSEYAESLAAWLKQLPRPCGMLVIHADLARWVTTVCLLDGLRVPEDIAIVTVTNDELACCEAPVPISSVTPRLETNGYEAAAFLDRWLRVEDPVAKRVLIPPGEVVERDSTCVFGVTEPLIRRALESIHRDDGGRLTVDTLLNELGNPSRRLLERSFRQAVGCSPYQHMLRQRIVRAQRMLRSTHRPLADIAAATGFSSPPQFMKHFKKFVGQTPARYRASERSKLKSPLRK